MKNTINTLFNSTKLLTKSVNKIGEAIIESPILKEGIHYSIDSIDKLTETNIKLASKIREANIKLESKSIEHMSKISSRHTILEELLK